MSHGSARVACAAGLALAATFGCARARLEPPPLLSGSSRCADPAARDVWDTFREERIDSTTSVYHPAWPAGALRVSDARILAGLYDLVVVTTSPRAGLAARGELTLVATHSEMADLRGLVEQMPLIGWATIDLRALGYLPLAHSLERRDPGRPGIQLSVEADSGRLSAVAGNSLEFRNGSVVSKTLHSGVWLYAFVADSARIVGRWSGGGLAEPGTEGYFCATKIGSPPPNGGW